MFDAFSRHRTACVIAALAPAFALLATPALAGKLAAKAPTPAVARAAPALGNVKSIRDHRVCKGTWNYPGKCHPHPYRPG